MDPARSRICVGGPGDDAMVDAQSTDRHATRWRRAMLGCRGATQEPTECPEDESSNNAGHQATVTAAVPARDPGRELIDVTRALAAVNLNC